MSNELNKYIAWVAANEVPGHDPHLVRKDACGAWIQWDHYGNRGSDWGWEVDHITPVSKGGGDGLLNLRALHWKNNAAKQDGELVCVCSAAAA